MSYSLYPGPNPELNRVKEIVKWRGPWEQIISRWVDGVRTIVPRKKAFVVKRGDQRFATVAYTQEQAETQVGAILKTIEVLMKKETQPTP